jgi:hypothetical protein
LKHRCAYLNDMLDSCKYNYSAPNWDDP